MNVAKLLPFLAALFPSAALAGPYGPFDPAENNVVSLNACESVEDVQQFYPPLGSIDFARAGDEARLHLTLAFSQQRSHGGFLNNRYDSDATAFRIVGRF